MITRQMMMFIALLAIGCSGCASQPSGKVRSITYEVSGGFAGGTTEQWTLAVSDVDEEGISHLLNRSHFFRWKDADRGPRTEDLFYIELLVESEHGTHSVTRREFSREAKESEIANLAAKIRQLGNQGSSKLSDKVDPTSGNTPPN